MIISKSSVAFTFISIFCTLSIIGCSKSFESVHSDLIKKMENEKIVEIDWTAEAKKYIPLTEVARQEMLKGFRGKKIKADIIVDDVTSYLALVHHRKYFENSKDYYGNFLVNVSNTSSQNRFTAILPKNNSNFKKGDKISVEGLIDSVHINQYLSRCEINLYPVKVLSK